MLSEMQQFFYNFFSEKSTEKKMGEGMYANISLTVF